MTASIRVVKRTIHTGKQDAFSIDDDGRILSIVMDARHELQPPLKILVDLSVFVGASTRADQFLEQETPRQARII